MRYTSIAQMDNVAMKMCKYRFWTILSIFQNKADFWCRATLEFSAWKFLLFSTGLWILYEVFLIKFYNIILIGSFTRRLRVLISNEKKERKDSKTIKNVNQFHLYPLFSISPKLYTFLVLQRSTEYELFRCTRIFSIFILYFIRLSKT